MSGSDAVPTTHLEVEDTYDVDDDAELPALESWPGVASVDTQRFALEATYFDTADLRATRAKVTVRRRTGGSDDGWHVKLPVGTDLDAGRQEVRMPLGRAVHTVPKRLRDTLRAHLRDEPMSPVAVLRTDRTVHLLRDARGAVLAEVADDRVTAESVREGRVQTWREWEVELVDGDRGLLAAARERLIAVGATPAVTSSKLARTLAGLVPPGGGVVRPGRKAPAADVVRARLVEQRAELLRRDPGVREDVADSVHQMRVACRRLRTVLATYRPVLDRTVTDPVRDELGWLASVLGEVRDSEVQRRHLARRLDALPDDTPGFAEAWAVIGSQTETWAAEARRRVLAALDSERYLLLLGRLDALIEQPPLTGAAEETVRRALTQRFRHDWKRLVRRVRTAGECEGDERDEALHEARKALKRVRYAAESLRPVYGRDVKPLVSELKQAQALLGDQHDTVAARAWLHGTAAAGRVDGAGFALGVLHERLVLRSDRLARRFDEIWPAVARPRLRAWLD